MLLNCRSPANDWIVLVFGRLQGLGNLKRIYEESMCWMENYE